MSYALAFVLALLGLTILFWNKPFAIKMGDFFARRHSGTFGRLATYLGWDDPNRPFNRFLYRVIVIFVGIIRVDNGVPRLLRTNLHRVCSCITLRSSTTTGAVNRLHVGRQM